MLKNMLPSLAWINVLPKYILFLSHKREVQVCTVYIDIMAFTWNWGWCPRASNGICGCLWYSWIMSHCLWSQKEYTNTYACIIAMYITGFHTTVAFWSLAIDHKHKIISLFFRRTWYQIYSNHNTFNVIGKAIHRNRFSSIYSYSANTRRIK